MNRRELANLPSVRNIREFLMDASDNERREIYYLIFEDYCTSCFDYIGNKTCHCENDE